MNSAQTVEVIVRLYIEKDADVTEVLQEMDYSFKYPGILATEIVDVNTELQALGQLYMCVRVVDKQQH